MKTLLRGVVVVLSFSVAGCAATSRVQAPYDSFVCFESTFNECLQTSQRGQLSGLHRQSFGAERLPGVLVDDQAGVVNRSADEKQECRFGRIPYTPALDRDAVSPVVFVSPVLVSEVSEQYERLALARLACDRLLDNYNFQQTVWTAQDQVASAQKGATLVSAALDQQRAASPPHPIGGTALGDRATEIGVDPALSERDAVKTQRETGIRKSDLLRETLRDRNKVVEFKRQFDDANIAIEMHLRAIARTLFVLDRATPSVPRISKTSRRYADGTWIMQGTEFKVAGGTSP